MTEENTEKTEKKVLSKAQNERNLIKDMKDRLDSMKFTATHQQIIDFLEVFEEFMKSRGISKDQIHIRRSKFR